MKKPLLLVNKQPNLLPIILLRTITEDAASIIWDATRRPLLPTRRPLNSLLPEATLTYGEIKDIFFLPSNVMKKLLLPMSERLNSTLIMLLLILTWESYLE